MSEASEILRTPSDSDLRDSHMAQYMRWLVESGYGRFDDYA